MRRSVGPRRNPTAAPIIRIRPSRHGRRQCAIAAIPAGTPESERVVYRIGVNLGDVLIEGEDILGDGVNIAARLEGICEPGGVLISGTAYDHVRGKVDAQLVDLGEKDLKNIARPVLVYGVKTGSDGAAPAPFAYAPNKAEPPHLSIVVLPFANISGDADSTCLQTLPSVQSLRILTRRSTWRIATKMQQISGSPDRTTGLTFIGSGIGVGAMDEAVVLR
jgi:hypothetical protein